MLTSAKVLIITLSPPPFSFQSPLKVTIPSLFVVSLLSISDLSDMFFFRRNERISNGLFSLRSQQLLSKES
jgi:hypothetical protein